jgi:hypothetical protein
LDAPLKIGKPLLKLFRYGGVPQDPSTYLYKSVDPTPSHGDIDGPHKGRFFKLSLITPITFVVWLTKAVPLDELATGEVWCEVSTDSDHESIRVDDPVVDDDGDSVLRSPKILVTIRGR